MSKIKLYRQFIFGIIIMSYRLIGLLFFERWSDPLFSEF